MRSERLKWLVKAEGPFARYISTIHTTLQMPWSNSKRNGRISARNSRPGRERGSHRQARGSRIAPSTGRGSARPRGDRDQRSGAGQRATDHPTTGHGRPFIGLSVHRAADRTRVQRPTYVFAAVDHTGAEVTLHQGGTIRSTTIEGAGYPVHKPVTAGWNGYGDLERTTEEAIRMNSRAIADELTRLVDEADPRWCLCAARFVRAQMWLPNYRARG